MKARLIRDMECFPTDDYPHGVKPKGTVLEDHRAHRLVQMGVAEPVDEECRRAANMSQEQFEAAQAAYPRLEAGILPEDFAAYEKGLMVGYDADNNWIPGPNADEDVGLADDESEEYDDDE